MKNDFLLLKEGTDVVLDNGIKTHILYNDLLKQDNEFTYADEDDRVKETYTDEYGDRFVILDLQKLTPTDIDWENDSIYVDQTNCKVNRNGDVFLADIDVPQDISKLDDDSLAELRGSITIGSLYLSDYNNEYFIDRSVLYEICNSFIEHQHENYDKDMDDHLGSKDFVDFIRNVA